MSAVTSVSRSVPPRARRGRVLIVGTSPAIENAAGLLVRPAIRVSSLFDALGEITIAPAAEPVAVVVLGAADLGSDPARVLRAVRRLDPSVRIVITLNHADERAAHAAALESADDVLTAPFTALELGRALETDIVADGPLTPPQPPPPAVQPRPTAPSSTMTPAEAAVPPARASAAAPAAEALADPAAPPALPAAAQTRSPDDPLGDTDLVESLLTSPDGVLPTALRLIAQQTEWTDVTLVETGAEPPHTASHDVGFNGRVFGRLATQFAAAGELRPWADWLGTWLALDRAHRDYRAAAFRDDLTGAWNRRFFDTFLAQAIREAGRRRRPVTLMVFDIDNFKLYNDTFGHEAGDDILRETVKLMNSVIRKGDRVCRIGGDEFAVIFADPEGPRERGSAHPESVETIARRFQDQVCQMKFPKLGRDAPGPLTISGGLATYPWDGLDARALLTHADQLALQSKRRGKNVITFGPGAHGPTTA
jgi:diguanylate cyclase (GGDEF)-like protein